MYRKIPWYLDSAKQSITKNPIHADYVMPRRFWIVSARVTWHVTCDRTSNITGIYCNSMRKCWKRSIEKTDRNWRQLVELKKRWTASSWAIRSIDHRLFHSHSTRCVSFCVYIWVHRSVPEIALILSATYVPPLKANDQWQPITIWNGLFKNKTETRKKNSTAKINRKLTKYDTIRYAIATLRNDSWTRWTADEYSQAARNHDRKITKKKQNWKRKEKKLKRTKTFLTIKNYY